MRLPSKLTFDAHPPVHLADALICSDCYGDYQYPGNEEARALFRYSDEDMAYLVNSRGEAVTTRGIIETTTMVNEIIGLTPGRKSSVTAYVGNHAPQSQGDGIRYSVASTLR